ncbi:ubiquitin-conjugating enzyme E2 T-like [Cylas formicarius]|uniref:ubiquitin-conjugating enzyme E2 T-like n=1 Tax=Cylas formicarius TaxID=197179 RepID=UPI0029583846|nr:ubiquitin-conjugating enzyme E2 T-like [Cylas formicarius]
MQRQTRLARELSKIGNSDMKTICVFAKDENMNVLEAQIIGPENTPYEKGIFKLEIIIPEKYPFMPPSIRFITKVYHPNIDENGRICMDLIKMPPKGSWKPTIGLEGVLIAIRMLLETPNPDDPLIADIAEQYKRSIEDFVKKAKEYTIQYAC